MYRILHNWLRAASLILLFFFACGCGSAPTVPAPTTCPPLGIYQKATIGSGDESSIEVFTNTYASTDPGGIAWCDVAQLGIQPTSLSGLPPCPYNDCLAAVDIKPDSVTITVVTGRPRLTYDLSVYSPKLPPENCAKDSLCYAFYRYGGSSWIYAGSATALATGSKWFAQGLINHFSVYALVELPPPQTLPGPRTLSMVVSSQFLDDQQGSMSVAFIVKDDSLGQLNAGTPELIFRFFNMDLAGIDGTAPEGCQKLGSYPEEFTCLFPIGAQAKLQLQLGTAQDHILGLLDYPESGYQARFFANPILVH